MLEHGNLNRIPNAAQVLHEAYGKTPCFENRQHAAVAAVLCLLVAGVFLLRAGRFHKGGRPAKKSFTGRLFGGHDGWLKRNLAWLILTGIVGGAMLISALLGASFLWVLLTGLLTAFGLAALIFILFVIFGGDRAKRIQPAVN